MFATLKNKLDLIFAKSWYFLRPKNKLGLVSFVILSSLFVSAWFVFTPAAQAFGLEDIMGWFAGIFFAIAGFFIKLTFWVLKFVIEIAGYNGYIDSPAVTVGWVMVRDMTNMFFIVVLLIISFGTILGLEHYEYKKLLVKVIMAAVIVNFSRIICGVIIDIAQVVMLTFVNGIAATASGNLVNMFNIQEIFKLGNGAIDAVKLEPSMMFIASIAALVFGTMMLITMATFLLLLMARMAMLWVLIVLSPFAFVLNVLPQTEKYASQWWGQFGGHVVGGPVIVFFLWLSFVTVGTGNAHDEIVKNNALKGENLMEESNDPQQRTGITEVMSWAKMANFAIAIAMLLAGAKMATELGMAGGEMMGKAGDIGKKVAMYASGYQAARWGAAGAYGLAAKGVKAGGKVVGMKLAEPFIRTGKTVGGAIGTAWKNLNWLRNEGAKKLETDTKKIRDLKYKRKLGQISKEDYVTEMAKLEGKGEARSKAMKELERKKAAGEISKDDYNKGVKNVNKKYGGAVGNFLVGGGMVGRGIKGMLASLIETGGRKMDRAENWMESYELAKEREELDYSNSSFAGGQVKRVMGELKEESEETKKEKGERKRAEMRVGALRGEGEGVMATMLTRQAGNMLKAEMQNRDWKGQVEVAKVAAEHEVLEEDKQLGQRMYRSEAEAKAAKAGHHADEEREVMEEERRLIDRDIKKLEEQKVGANGETAAQVQKQIEDKRRQMRLLQQVGKEQGGAFDSQATLKLLSEIKNAINQEAGSDKQKAILESIEKDESGMKRTFAMMFGKQQLTDLVADRRNLDALENIERTIQDGGADSEGKEIGAVFGETLGKASKSIEDSVARLNHVWEKAAHHSPSMYAARAEALRDHEYAFYRGKKQELKDNASQAEIWDKMGIETPGGAAQQAVAEELYAKTFKDMNYNQLVAALRAHKNYVRDKKEEVTDKDRLIGMALLEKMLAESWVDDGESVVREARELRLRDSQVANVQNRRNILRPQSIRLSKGDIEQLAGGFGGLADLEPELIQAIQRKEQIAIDTFMKKFKDGINNNATGFMGKKAEQIVHLLQNAERDQFEELVEKIKASLKK